MDNRPISKHILPIAVMAVTILIGYYELFGGATFFAEDDPLIVYDYAHHNAVGNGWRPDKGLGISFFYGDPGLFHAWSVFSLLEKVTRLPLIAYDISVLLMLLLAAIAQYFFIRRVAPNIGSSACIIAPLIIFGPLQHEFLFQRHWITLCIGTPLLIMLLYDYFKKPMLKHLLYGSLLLWFTWFFGSFASFFQLLIVGLLFTALFYIYFKPPILKAVSSAAIFFAVSGAVTAVLGFWVFYTIYLESTLVKYIRDPIYVTGGILNLKYFFNFDIKFITAVFLNFFSCGWLSSHVMLTGLDSLIRNSWFNCSVVFPYILLFFLFRRSSDFWEFSLKWLIMALYINELLMYFSPAYSDLFQAIVNGYHLSKFQTAYHCLQIGLIGVFLGRLLKDIPQIKNRWLDILQKAMAVSLFAFYSALAFFNALLLFIPKILASSASIMIDRYIPANVHGYPKDLISCAVSIDLQSLISYAKWYHLLFYLSSALMAAVFIRRKWFLKTLAMPKELIAGILLVNGILLSWTVYPLYKKELTWNNKGVVAAMSSSNPTDRFYNVFELERQRTKKSAQSLKENWFDSSGNVRQYTVGFWYPPGLDLSSTKSFCQKEVGDFIFYMFNEDAKKKLEDLRTLSLGGPMISSKLFDMCAVSYYYSFREMPDLPETMKLIYRSAELYVYKNLSAWPYYYLAERAEVLKEGAWPKDPSRGTVYLNSKDGIGLAQGVGDSSISLKRFSYGKMVFDYAGSKDNILVVADAWHPFWRAMADGHEVPVIKANGVFKGVRLPSGRHEVVLYFDTKPFRPGIYVSAFGWLSFLAVLCLAIRRKWELPFLKL